MTKLSANAFSLEKSASGEVALNEAVFGLPVRGDILQRVVEWQRARRQAGTHKTKEIHEVSGTTKKPFRQKGTGNARQGSLRSPQMRGGAVIFGPVVRSHAYKLPKKIRTLGLKTALSAKQAEGKLFVADELSFSKASTSALKANLAKQGITSVLFIGGAEVDSNLLKAAGNLYKVDVLPQQGANVYDILNHEHLVISKDALKHFEERLV